MKINAIEIDGSAGTIRIQAIGADAVRVSATAEGRTAEIATVYAGDDEDGRKAKMMEIARAVYGTDRNGRVAATNSMVWEVAQAIEQVARF